MKIFIAGAGGTLGATTAYTLALRELADEIVLYDINENAALHHAMDITQGMCLLSDIRITAGGLEDMAGSDLIIVAAGLPLQKSMEQRLMNLAGLKPLVEAMAEQVSALAPGAAVFSLTNPVDVFNYILWERMGLPRTRFFGLSLCDTIRMRHGIAHHTGIPADRIESYVVGEHGQTKVPLYSGVMAYGGKRAMTEQDIQAVQGFQTDWWNRFTSLGIPRTAGWTSAAAVAMLVEIMYGRREGILPCSCIPEGEYGLSGLSIGLPVRLCPAGVAGIVEVPMAPEEKAALMHSAETVRAAIGRLKEVMYP